VRARPLASFALGALVGCRAIVGIGDVVPSEDAGTTADADLPAADASNDAIVNLLRNPGFESGCSEWGTSGGATKLPDSIARTGSGACLVCGPSGNWQFFQVLYGAFSGEYVFQMHVRTLVDAATSATIGLSAVARNEAGAEVTRTDETGLPPPS
jgi:hypothetical protein